MQMRRDFFVLCSALLGFSVLALYWKFSMPTKAEPERTEVPAPAPQSRPFVTFVDPARGPADAPVTIVEFGDHVCPYCVALHDGIDRLSREHPDEVRFVWKSAPSPSHPGAQTAAEAAMCAMRQGRFWEFHAALMNEGPLLDQASMAILANELGLDVNAFGTCLSSGEARPLIERTVSEAKALGVTGIPTVFINDARYEGALSYDQLLEAAGF